jgi:hypothetical protein
LALKFSSKLFLKAFLVKPSDDGPEFEQGYETSYFGQSFNNALGEMVKSIFYPLNVKIKLDLI